MCNSMNAESGCFVSGSLAIVLHLARLVGVAPLTFVKRKPGWHIYFSPCWNIFGYCHVIILMLVTTGSIIADKFRPRIESLPIEYDIIRIMWHVKLLSLMTVAGTTIFGAKRRMRSMIACINHLQKINSMLNIHEWPVSIREERKKNCILFLWAVLTLTAGYVYMALLTINSNKIHTDSSEKMNEQVLILYNVGYFPLYWMIQTQMVLFIVLSLQVIYSFRAVNERLKHVLDEKAPVRIKFEVNNPPVLESTGIKIGAKMAEPNECLNKNVNVISVTGNINSACSWRPRHETVHGLALAYISTCNVVKEVDRCHGLIVLLILGITLQRLVIMLYNMIFALLDMDAILRGTWMNTVRAVSQIFWCLYHILSVVVINEPSHLTKMEMELTRELVSQLLYCAPSAYEPLALELQLFSRHLMLHQVSYSPMKVATLKRSLVVTILSSIFAYLVVMVQLYGSTLSVVGSQSHLKA